MLSNAALRAWVPMFIMAFLTMTALREAIVSTSDQRLLGDHSGWIDNGISQSSQGRIWVAKHFRTYRDMPRGQVRQLVPRSKRRPKTQYSCTKWAVITTIFEPTTVCHQIARLSGWCLVIVADKKTQWTDWVDFVEHNRNTVYLSPTKQNALGYSITKFLKHNHFGVKNVGYLFAIEHGAQYIWDTDDDNQLKKSETLLQAVEQAAQNAEVHVADGNHHLWNPYPNFQPIRLTSARSESICWPRGFPLEYVKDESTQSTVSNMDSVPSSAIGVYQSLADNDPDVDGIYRLTKDIPFKFSKTGEKVALGKNRYAPFNAQATLWMRRAFWSMLMPISVHGRVTDIWRSYITERLFADVGMHVAFTSPLVTQIRNAHSLIADLQSEIPLYTKANELTKWLLRWNGTGSLADRMEQLAIALYEIGIIEEEDVGLYRSWLDDLESIGYEMPSTQPVPMQSRTVAIEKNSRAPRVAVCISGQLRTLTTPVSSTDYPRRWHPMSSSLALPKVTVAESVRNNLYPKLGGKPDVFMYVSTRESQYEPKIGNESVCEPLRSKGRLFCQVPAEKRIPIANISQWQSFFFPGEATAMQGLLQQLKGMFECHRAIEEYSKKSGKEYDWIVRLRPDVYIKSFPSLEKLAMDAKAPTVWYASLNTCCCGNEDWFGVAPTKWMREYFDRYLYFQQTEWTASPRWTAEFYLRSHLSKMGVRLKPHKDIKACVIKPRHRRSHSDP